MVESAASTSAADIVIAEEDSDLACVERVQAGDVAAFDQLVRRYRERLYSVMYNMVGNREDAADLTQDAFIRAFRSIRRFRRNASFYTWLYRIALNRATSHLRRHRARQFFSLDNFDEEAAPASELLGRLVARHKTDRATLLRELQEKLNEAIHKLSVKHRTAVILHEIDGRSHAEIARITGTTEGTVRSRLHYAKQQLQVSLQGFLD
ncbi:MAG: sigma-70 family RNA polymerase sigma factor [Opitutales bacterium]